MRINPNLPKSMYLDELLFSDKLIIKRSDIHRWGVFAREKIEKYEILEESPYFKVPIEEIKCSAICENYSYYHCSDYHIIGMGFAGLYNHSRDKSNVNYEVDCVNEVMRHYAVCDIDVGEELTLNYGEVSFDN
jgi:SET domain-containing protein